MILIITIFKNLGIQIIFAIFAFIFLEKTVIGSPLKNMMFSKTSSPIEIIEATYQPQLVATNTDENSTLMGAAKDFNENPTLPNLESSSNSDFKFPDIFSTDEKTPEPSQIKTTTNRRKPRKMSRTQTERIVDDEDEGVRKDQKNSIINSLSSSESLSGTKNRPRSRSLPLTDQPTTNNENQDDKQLVDVDLGFVNLNCPEQAAFLK